MTENTTSAAIEPGWFRQVLGQYPTGVSVVTSVEPGGGPIGLAVGSFTSVSLDPPLVAFLPATTSSTWPRIQATGRFCVNVLAADQEHVCRAFASKVPDKFAGLDWRPAASGTPILDQAVAWVDCDIEAVHEAGDHVLVVGRVRELDHVRPTLPLLFFQGGYGGFAPRSLAVRDARFRDQLKLVDRARPLMEAAARRLGAQIAAAYCDGSELTLLASAGTPTDPTVSSAAIGQHLAVAAPMGIWWAAFSPQPQAERWLGTIASPELQAAYREALALIGERGYCLGLSSVRTAVEEIIDGRSRPVADHQRVELPDDPMAYVPAPAGQSASARPDVDNLWAPTYTPEGEVALGLMLAGYPDDGRPAEAYAEDLLALAAEVTELAGT